MCTVPNERRTITRGQGCDSVVEITNLFGHDYNAYMRGAVPHATLADVMIWWPTIKTNEDDFYCGWNNRFNPEESRLVERSDDPNLMANLLDALRTGGVFGGLRQRKTVYIFSRELPCDGGDGRRIFKGVFQFNESASNAQDGIVWDRTATEVMTYRPR